MYENKAGVPFTTFISIYIYIYIYINTVYIIINYCSLTHFRKFPVKTIIQSFQLVLLALTNQQTTDTVRIFFYDVHKGQSHRESAITRDSNRL